jgi:hypothetical protein
MPMSDIVRLHNQWRGFTTERSRAQKEVNEKNERDLAEIARLQEGISERNRTFEDVWKGKKARLQQQRDEAVMQEMANGTPAQTILKEIQSNNTVWIYGLRRKLLAEMPIPEQTNVNTRNAHGTTAFAISGDSTSAETEKGTTLTLAPRKWRYHNHVGVHGWLLSEDYTEVKKYGAEGTDFEGAWFIASRDGVFIEGNEELFDATPKGEITRRTNMLEQLLEGTYVKAIKERENKYTG